MRRCNNPTLSLIPAGMLLLSSLAAGAAEPPLDVGSRRQLFVDRRLIERLEGEARLVLHTPQPQEIALRSDQPWEGSSPGYMTVFRDGDRYRLYYRVAAGHVEDTDERQYTCYAESADGIRWTKPRLGLVEFAGSKENNIIWQGALSHNFTPFRDENPAAPPAERYKAVGGPTVAPWAKGFDPARHGLMMLVSADGIRWRKRDDKPLALRGNFDSQNVLFWDSAAGLYRIFWRDHRGDSPQQPAGRDIRTATSPDCRTWSEREWLVYDPARSGSPERDEAGDPTGDHHQLYTSGIQPYPRSPGLLVGLPERYSDRGWTRSTERLPDRDVRKARADKGIGGGRPTRLGTVVTDVLFMASRDGRQFFVWPEAFVRPGIQRPGTWYYGGAWPALGFTETASPYPGGPPELSIYLQEGDGPLTFENKQGAVRRHTLRLDGFASVRAPLTGGRLVTKPFVFAGDALAINFSTSGGGRIRIGFTDATGEPLEGRSLDDCDLVYGDEHDRVVSWRGEETLAGLAGKPVRMVAELKDADLFAIRFGASAGAAGNRKAEAAHQQGKPATIPLFHNEDCTEFFSTQPISSGQAGTVIDQYVDRIADSGATVLLCNTNARRTNYRSGVWDAFWDGYDPAGPDDQPFLRPIPPGDRASFRKGIDAMLAVHQQGIDYPARVIQRCRQRGVTPWITLRMNDCHNNDLLDHPFHGRFWQENPRFFRQGSSDYFARCLDYAHREVRDFYRALIVETLERYDIDGLELDFMREPYLFSVRKEAEGAPILTGWLREIRSLTAAAAARRGHPIRLGVRVPSRPETARAMGLDAAGWAQQGLIDLLVVTPRWETLEFDMPLEAWRTLLAGTDVQLAGGLESLYRPMPNGQAAPVSPELATGAAVNVLSRGADAVYLFNYFHPAGAWNGTRQAMTSLPRLLALPRRVGVTFRDIRGPGETYTPPLPATGTNLPFTMRIGPLEPGHGRSELVLEFAPPKDAVTVMPTVEVNGERVEVHAKAVAKDGVTTATFTVPATILAATAGQDIRVTCPEAAPITVRRLELLYLPILQIGSRKQLFIDERFVTDERDVALVVNPPVKAGPVDVAAETAPCVVEHRGVCHLYQGLNGRTSLWTSTDGLAWKAHGPLAGHDDAGPMWTSINSVFIDPKDAEYPFKGLYERTPKVMVEPETGRNHVAPVPGGLFLCRSRDGITWDYLPRVAIPFTCDTQNQMLYDPWRDRYAAYVRAFPEVSGPWKHKRCVARVETADLLAVPWPHRTNPANIGSGKHDFPYINDELDLVMGPDADDPPMTDLYNPCMHVYPEAEAVYLAFPSMYRCWGYDGNSSAGRDHRGNFFNDGIFETQLAVSRDGVHFTRHHVPYLLAGLVRDRSGSEGDIDCGLMWIGIGMLRRGDEIWQYCYGSRRTHEDKTQAEKHGRKGEAIIRLVQRLDGFMSIDAGPRGGGFTTPPVVFAGDRLVLNAACHGLGEIWLEILDEAGRPIPGFARADAISVARNGTAQEVWWKQGPDVSALAGRPVRLRFDMRSAKLYAFQFTTTTAGR